ncbi:MAG TPA: 50S ribosomal protein L25/general stress protein Ctc, partial [Rhizomicrobium sp.]|nr:50S ribosomal protein L25/general stress protein Ctc [Rhizomicrobium sp.]
TGTGKGPSYQTRQKGFIPAVLYGGKDAPENVAVERMTLERHVGTGNFLTTLFNLDVEGKKQRVIPRAIQLDPVTDRPVHVDFMRLAEGAKVKLEIPVRFKNHAESPGLKKGGVLNIIRHEVLMLCPAENIPDAIEADLAGLDIHGTVHISSIALPEGVKPLIHERDFTIASIVAPTSVIEEARAAAEAAAAAASAPAAAEGAAAPAEGAAAAPAAGAAPAADAKAAPKK